MDCSVFDSSGFRENIDVLVVCLSKPGAFGVRWSLLRSEEQRSLLRPRKRWVELFVADSRVRVFQVVGGDGDAAVLALSLPGVSASAWWLW